MNATLEATVNGEHRQLQAGMTLAALLEELGVEARGIAVAVNERIVRKSTFEGYTLQDGDVVEIIRAVAGG